MTPRTRLATTTVALVVTLSTGLSTSQAHAQEFCGTGHEGMWGKVEIIDKAAFARLAAAGGRLRCAE